MQLTIAVENGMVSGVYRAQTPGALQVFVVDLDGAKIGEVTKAQRVQIERLADAPREVWGVVGVNAYIRR